MKKNGIKLLLVEDNPDEAGIIKARLENSKNAVFNITAVDSLEAALKHLAGEYVDVIMLDLMLPDSRGRDTFMQVYSRFPDTPIIVLSCVDDEAQALTLVQEGAQDYLIKGQSEVNMLARVVSYAIERNYVRKASKDALERMRELNEIKSQFVAEASHEIRTPLAIVREFVSLVHDETTGKLNEKQRNYLASALRNCDKLTELINHILDLARIEAGKKELHLTKVDLAAVLTQFRNDFVPLVGSKKQTIHLDIAGTLLMAHCDAASVQDILTNLIGNAHKYTPEGGNIRLACRQEGRFLRVSVTDDGPGIPLEQQERVFEPFIRLTQAKGPASGGAGLGLKIVKSLVEMNGGSIALESVPGKGSTFSFTLPGCDAEMPLRILIVDNEESVVRMIESILTSSDFNLEIKSTQKGLNSLMVAGEFKPDLVILDVYLDDVDGKQVLTSLKHGRGDKQRKVLMISGYFAVLKELKEWGADDFLAKPFTADDLLNKVGLLLGIQPKTYLMPDLPGRPEEESLTEESGWKNE
jgi:signal transduction histidine kinase